MTSGILRFDRFELDPADRRLSRDGAPVELSARYLDALLLLTSEQGRLVTKDRFHDEVWRGIPVTDEALTQCITTLRHTSSWKRSLVTSRPGSLASSTSASR